MAVIYILVFVAIFLAGGFLLAFIWAVKSGQYEDTYTPSVRMLFDDPEKKESENEKNTLEIIEKENKSEV